MHVHLPKPVHGWRAFLGEVGIIVLGIVIALSLEAIVASSEHRQSVRHAEEDIRQELQGNDQSLRKMIASEQRAQKGLELLKQFLSGRAARGSAEALPAQFAIPNEFETMDTAAWESTVATEAFSHMPSSEVRSIAKAYAGSRELNAFEQLAVRQWVEMSSYVSDPRTISRDDAKGALRQVSVALTYDMSLIGTARGLLKVNNAAIRAIEDH